MVYHVSQSEKVKDNKDSEVNCERLLEDGSLPQKPNPSLKSKLSLWSAVNFILALLAAAVLAILGMLCTNELEGEMIVVFIMFGIHLLSTLVSAVCSWRMESSNSTSGFNLLRMLASGVILLSVLGIVGFVAMINKASLDDDVCARNGEMYMLAYGVSSIVMYSFSMVVFHFCFS